MERKVFWALFIVPGLIADLIFSLMRGLPHRQAYKDRISAEHDYEVNLKAELEIIALHDKIDSLKEK